MPRQWSAPEEVGYFDHFIKMGERYESVFDARPRLKKTHADQIMDYWIKQTQTVANYVSSKDIIYYQLNDDWESNKDYEGISEALGMDYRAWAEDKAANHRFDAPKPPFRIGRLTISTAERGAEFGSFTHDLVTAQNDYESALKVFDANKSELDAAMKVFSQRIDAINQPVDEAQRAYREKVAAISGRNDEGAAGRTAQAESLAARVSQLDRRVSTIDSRVALPDSVFGGAAIANQRRADLRAEQAEHRASIAALQLEIERLAAPAMTEEDTAVLRELVEGRDQARREAGRKRRLEEDRVERQVNNLDRSRAALNDAEEVYAGLRQRGERVREARNPMLRQISSRHYRAKITDDVPDVAGLERAIADLRATQLRVATEREQARRDMLSINERAGAAADALMNAGYASALSQASVDAAMQLIDVAKAGLKGGPSAAAITAVDKVLWNSNSPPTIYDVQQTSLADYARDGNELVTQAFIDTSAGGNANRAIKGGTKEAASLPVKLFLQHLNEAKLTKDRATNLDRLRENGARMTTALRNKFQDRIREQTQAMDKVKNEIRNTAVKNGIREFAKQSLTNVGKGFVESFAADALKRTLSVLMEKPAFDRYMRAQLDLAAAVRAFRVTGNAYWQNEDMLADLRAARDELDALDIDPVEGVVVEKNEEFIVDSGYDFVLFLKEGQEVQLGAFQATVRLGGVELKRQTETHGITFVVDAADRNKFDDTLPPELPLEVTIHLTP